MPFVQAEPIIVDTKLVGKQLDEYIDFLTVQMTKAGHSLKIKLMTPPPYKYVSWKSIGGFKSPAQARLVKSYIRQGIIKVPPEGHYDRTGRLDSSWKMEVKDTQKEVKVTIFNNQPHAQWVQRRSTQDKRMKIIGWPTVEDMAEKEWPKEAVKIKRAASRYKP